METRAQILNAARHLIETKGIGKVTTRDIVRAAGFADGTMYVHFAQKEDLLLATLSENLPALVDTIAADRAGRATVSANLEAMGHAALRFYEEVIPLAASLFSDANLLARFRESTRSRGGGPQRVQEKVANYIRAEQRLGRIDSRAYPSAAASLLLGACFQYAFFRAFLGERPLPAAKKRFIRDLIKILAVALAAPGEHPAPARDHVLPPAGPWNPAGKATSGLNQDVGDIDAAAIPHQRRARARAGQPAREGSPDA